MASGADRNVDITFGLQVVETHPLFPYFLEKHLAIPTSSFFSSINDFFVLVSILLTTPYLAYIGGRYRWVGRN